MSIFVGLTYAELTPALPLAGGEWYSLTEPWVTTLPGLPGG